MAVFNSPATPPQVASCNQVNSIFKMVPVKTVAISAGIEKLSQLLSTPTSSRYEFTPNEKPIQRPHPRLQANPSDNFALHAKKRLGSLFGEPKAEAEGSFCQCGEGTRTPANTGRKEPFRNTESRLPKTTQARTRPPPPIPAGDSHKTTLCPKSPPTSELANTGGSPGDLGHNVLVRKRRPTPLHHRGAGGAGVTGRQEGGRYGPWGSEMPGIGLARDSVKSQDPTSFRVLHHKGRDGVRKG